MAWSSPFDAANCSAVRATARAGVTHADQPEATAARQLGPPTASTEPTDAELLRRFWTGDDADAGLFVRRFQPRVYGIAVRILFDRGIAEEVAQEAFLRVWRSSATYDPSRGSVGTWVARITRNLAIDYLRRRRLPLADPDGRDEYSEPYPTDDPFDAAVTSTAIVGVSEALAQLPAEQRRAVMLAAYWGCTAQEISEQEGIPLGTAKTRIRRGLMQIRAALTAAETPEPAAASSVA